jgi:hypothetical protein
MSFLFLLLSLNSFVFAANDPRPDMMLLAQELSAMQKFLLTEADFAASSNEPAIKKSLGAIGEHLTHLEKNSFQDPALKVNLTLLRGHIGDANRAFLEGNKSFSRFMIQSGMQMCIVCHTRTKSADFSYPNPDLAKASLVERADFYFATRQFQKGSELYQELVAGFPGNKIGLAGLNKAVMALAVYYARVKDDAAGGAEYFSKIGKRSDLPNYLQKELSVWAGEFKRWSQEKKENETKLTETQLLTQAKRLLKQDDFSLVGQVDKSFHVRRLRASALLHRALESGSKSPAKGEALYYLGQIYHRVSSHFFFRFGEMYLKACVQEYPKTSVARDCYGALEQAVREGYTGSGGVDVPDDEEIELIKLRRLAY